MNPRSKQLAIEALERALSEAVTEVERVETVHAPQSEEAQRLQRLVDELVEALREVKAL